MCGYVCECVEGRGVWTLCVCGGEGRLDSVCVYKKKGYHSSIFTLSTIKLETHVCCAQGYR